MLTAYALTLTPTHLATVHVHDLTKTSDLHGLDIFSGILFNKQQDVKYAAKINYSLQIKLWHRCSYSHND